MEYAPDSGKPSDPRNFATTHWSVVVAAGDDTPKDARDALAVLCEAYWCPLYTYVRRRGYAVADAQDLTQAFFARLLEKRALRVADPERGKFRTFLLASLDNFLANEHDRAQAQKRGGGRKPLSLDIAAAESKVSLEPAHDLTPERLFERQWALTLLELAVNRVEAEYHAAGKSELFRLLKDVLGGGRERVPYADVAVALGMSIANVRQAAHRLRKRYREVLREEVARTLASEGEVDEELSSLFESLGS